ncbi:MAG: Flp family type IVb pilin [Acidimicrobiia bacterium]|nr:Flp family type IVb pilin [Acidimicrobiia bacterium]
MNPMVFKTWFEAKFRMHEDERGANLVEYILLVALIALLVIGAVAFLRSRVENKFSEAGSSLN